jgi:hypothetical protein
VRDSFVSEKRGKQLVLLDRYGADEDRLTFVVKFFHFACDRLELSLFRLVDLVVVVDTDRRAVRRDRNDVETVYLEELFT